MRPSFRCLHDDTKIIDSGVYSFEPGVPGMVLSTHGPARTERHRAPISACNTAHHMLIPYMAIESGLTFLGDHDSFHIGM